MAVVPQGEKMGKGGFSDSFTLCVALFGFYDKRGHIILDFDVLCDVCSKTCLVKTFHRILMYFSEGF